MTSWTPPEAISLGFELDYYTVDDGVVLVDTACDESVLVYWDDLEKTRDLLTKVMVKRAENQIDGG